MSADHNRLGPPPSGVVDRVAVVVEAVDDEAAVDVDALDVDMVEELVDVLWHDFGRQLLAEAPGLIRKEVRRPRPSRTNPVAAPAALRVFRENRRFGPHATHVVSAQATLAGGSGPRTGDTVRGIPPAAPLTPEPAYGSFEGN
jgi:hypothetical protein